MFGWEETSGFHFGVACGNHHTPCPPNHLMKKSEPFSNIRTGGRNKIILFWASLRWMKVNYSLDWKLEDGQRPAYLTPLYSHDQTEGRSSDYACNKAHRYVVLQKEAQLHHAKGKSLAETFEREGIERRMRRKIESLF